MPSAGEYATEWGSLNLPSAEPSDPNWKSNWPSAKSTWMRWLPVSATAMRELSGDQATEWGSSNRPSYPPNWLI